MKAISLTQPWATLVAIGAKRYETRSWKTEFRGRLLIHAAKGFPRWARECCDEPLFREALAEAGYSRWQSLPVGYILGSVGVLDCMSTESVEVDDREREFGDYGPARWAWQLDQPRKLTIPYSCVGALGLWNVPPDVMGMVSEVL